MTEQAVATVTDQLAEYADKFMAKMEYLAETYGDQVVDAALAVARIDALNELFLMFCAVLFPIIIGGFYWGAWKIARGIVRDDKSMQGFEWFIAGIGGLVWMGLTLAVLLSTNWSIWPIVGVFQPELWIVAKALGMV